MSSVYEYDPFEDDPSDQVKRAAAFVGKYADRATVAFLQDIELPRERWQMTEEIARSMLDRRAAAMAEATALEDFRAAKAKKLRVLEGSGDQPRQPEILDLAEYFSYPRERPQPTIGGQRSDNRMMLYPGKWHTCIALTAAGKSWLALWHAAAVMAEGQTVVYLHFEEETPESTFERLAQLGVSEETIQDYFVWVTVDSRFAPGRMAELLDGLEPALVILDGINAACSLHGWKTLETEAVGQYRATLVRPATTLGAAVLSLGHPPKGRDRQGERHGFGSTAWLDEVDGAGFRLVASKTPIGRGRLGSSHLYTVKDRNGEVERHGVLSTEQDREGWYFLGSMIVDDSGAGPVGLDDDDQDTTTIRVQVPETTEDGEPVDRVDKLAATILAWLEAHGGQYASERQLGDAIRADRTTVTGTDLAVALERLENAGKITRPPYVPRQARPGRLVTTAPETTQTEES